MQHVGDVLREQHEVQEAMFVGITTWSLAHREL